MAGKAPAKEAKNGRGKIAGQFFSIMPMGVESPKIHAEICSKLYVNVQKHEHNDGEFWRKYANG